MNIVDAVCIECAKRGVTTCIRWLSGTPMLCHICHNLLLLDQLRVADAQPVVCNKSISLLSRNGDQSH